MVGLIRHEYEDLGTSFDRELCDCHEFEEDGYDDLSLKFDTEEIVNVLGDVNDGDVLELTLQGELFDGTPIEGRDCIVILEKGRD